MTSTPKPAARRLGRVLVNHVGFICAGAKQVIVMGGDEGEFELQNMSLITQAAMGEGEGYQGVLRGRLRRVDSPLGPYSVGDFSGWTAPGIYRVALPATGEHSYQFAVTDGAFGGFRRRSSISCAPGARDPSRTRGAGPRTSTTRSAPTTGSRRTRPAAGTTLVTCAGGWSTQTSRRLR